MKRNVFYISQTGVLPLHWKQNKMVVTKTSTSWDISKMPPQCLGTCHRNRPGVSSTYLMSHWFPDTECTKTYEHYSLYKLRYTYIICVTSHHTMMWKLSHQKHPNLLQFSLVQNTQHLLYTDNCRPNFNMEAMFGHSKSRWKKISHMKH